MTDHCTRAGEKPLSLSAWVCTISIALVPIINVAVLFYWSFGNRVDPNRRNFSRAALIVIAFLIALAISILCYKILTTDPHERIKGFMMME